MVTHINKTVLITGASRGIGAATALLFAQNGYNVVLHYHKSKEAAKRLQQTIKGMGASAVLVRANVASKAQVDKMILQATDAFGKIDVLVNNAGIAQQKLLSDISEQEWDTMFDVNIKSLFLVTQDVLPQMIHRKCGAIVNVSSIWGICGASCEVHYSAAKAAVIGFTKALAKEVGPSGITVNCVAPGVIKTDMIAEFDEQARQQLIQETPIERLGEPIDVARSIYFLANEKFITGQILSTNGGLVI
ncbi:MAG: 3-oxoacyl-ACP reductase FabG [Christensenellaceae bacterium]